MVHSRVLKELAEGLATLYYIIFKTSMDTCIVMAIHWHSTLCLIDA